jgi:oligoendopeptidase F
MQTSNSAIFFLLVLFLLTNYNHISAQTERSEIEEKYKWDLSHIYSSDDDWRTDLEKSSKNVDFARFKDKLSNSPDSYFEYLTEMMGILEKFHKLNYYVLLKSYEDKRITKYDAMKGELMQRYGPLWAQLSELDQESSSLTADKIKEFCSLHTGLKKYEEWLLKNASLETPDTLTVAQKRINLEAERLVSHKKVFDHLITTELPYPTVELSNGEKAYIDDAGYTKYIYTANRSDREKVYKTFWTMYDGFKNTYTELLKAQVNFHIYKRNLYGFDSCLESELFGKGISAEKYEKILSEVNKNLETNHRYYKIKQRFLEVDTLRKWDNIGGGVNLTYSYEEAQELIYTALKLLGEEYLNILNTAFNNRWIDVYPNIGKRQGGTCGFVPIVHPYVLINFDGSYGLVRGLAHELGHAISNYFSDQHFSLPVHWSHSMLNEVESNVNEALLNHYMLSIIKDPDQRLIMLLQILEYYQQIFTSAKIAEFELAYHKHAENGKPFTSDVIKKLYLDIEKKYSGKYFRIEGDFDGIQWAWFHHLFKYDFYNYKYIIGLIAPVVISQDIINGSAGAVDKYLSYLGAGQSKNVDNLLLELGIDLNSSVPFDKTISAMNKLMDEVELILDKKGL